MNLSRIFGFIMALVLLIFIITLIRIFGGLIVYDIVLISFIVFAYIFSIIMAIDDILFYLIISIAIITITSLTTKPKYQEYIEPCRNATITKTVDDKYVLKCNNDTVVIDKKLDTNKTIYKYFWYSSDYNRTINTRYIQGYSN